MIVRPSTIFNIIQDVPFDDSYEHVILFSSKERRDSYFLSKTIASFTDFTYVKEQNIVRVPMLADAIYNCNYCMFKNVGFGDRWFYGFITNIEYVNNELSAITIDIDFFQTWFYDCNIEKSYVEREHVKDDTIGINTVDEGIYFGDNVVMGTDSKLFNEWKINCMMSPSMFGSLIEDDQRMYYAWNQYYPLSFKTDMDNIEDFNRWLDARTLAQYDVIGMFMYPSEFQEDGGAQRQRITFDTGNETISRPIAFSDSYSGGSYKPVNNKLLTYPYTYLHVETNEGNSMDYRWEFVSDGVFKFYLYDNIINQPSCFIEPNYREASIKYTLPINSFPDVTYSINTFLQQLPMKAIGGSLKQLSGGISDIVVGSQSRTPTRGQWSAKGKQQTAKGAVEVADFATSIGSGMLSTYKTSPSSYTNNIALKFDRIGYIFYTMGIRKEYAQILDDYFTRFGYKVCKFKVPELYSRTAFNYVKTVECEISGKIPTEAHRAISSMFDNGITLWHTTSIGNFTTNSIVQ